MSAAHGRAFARAALAGNPSDGYGGAVLAITVEAFSARASVGDEVDGDECVARDLVDATVARFTHEFGVAATPVAASTSIPRSVGLGGSSAIVIATLRALCAHHVLTLDPDPLAMLALSIEVDDLGIAAGPQDRLVQAHEGLVFMDFAAVGASSARLETATLPPLLLGWRDDSAEHSGVVHSDLRERYDAGDPNVRSAMAALACRARDAKDASLSADTAGLRAAVDASFDLRRTLTELDPRHVAMVEAARSAGAAANYTGSGGAVICVCNDLDHRDAVAQVLREGGAATVAVSHRS
jgi:glucuronokinase